MRAVSLSWIPTGRIEKCVVPETPNGRLYLRVSYEKCVIQK
jgi:hypothetical protein